MAITTLSFHWNVDGPQFLPLHRLFGEQYRELWDALDPIGERIRALGGRALPDHTDNVVVPLSPSAKDIPGARAMVERLAQGHDAMTLALDAACDVARDAEDEASLSLLADRALVHGSHLWMLRASIGSEASP